LKRPSLTVLLILLLSFTAFSADKKMASSYMNDGIAFYDAGNYIEAILNLRSAEQLAPNPISVDKYLGMAYTKLSLWAQAEIEFNKIIFVQPDDADRPQLLEKIRALEEQSDTPPAMAQFTFYSIKYKNKIYKEPENLLNYLSLTEIYKCSGRYTEAENFFKSLVKDRPDKLVFKKYLAEVYYLDKKYAEAGSLYRSILEVEPLNTDALIGVNLIIKKRYLDELRGDPSRTAANIKLARAYNDLKRYEDAITEYNKFLETDSANLEVIREKEETQKILNALVPAK
jgi:tetratricopeptide (TPR) repeat protein